MSDEELLRTIRNAVDAVHAADGLRSALSAAQARIRELEMVVIRAANHIAQLALIAPTDSWRNTGDEWAQSIRAAINPTEKT